MKLGAHRVISSRDSAAMKGAAGSFDFILNTANANLDWGALFEALAPRGRLHTVGVVPDPVPMPSFAAIVAQRSMGGSPLGSPVTTRKMIDFAARHGVAPQIETFPMSRANEALRHVRDGKARYRVVLTNDLN
jgi:uncharacterized zinc-type alcohol dehydrogenase-like protein